MHIPFVIVQLVVTVVLDIITVVSTLLEVNRLYLCSVCDQNIVTVQKPACIVCEFRFPM